MRAASRETFRAASDELDALAKTADPATLNTVGDDLLAVAGLLDREPRLRRALADPARPGPDRADLVGGLVAGKVSADSGKLLARLAGGRWSSTAELLDGVELLGVDALLAAVSAQGDLGEVEDELFRFGQVVDASPELAAALGDVTVDASQRGTLIDTLLKGKAKAATVRLVKLAVVGFGGRTFAGALTRLVELAAERRARRVAYVTVAAPLTDAEEERLAAQLAGMYGQDVSLMITVEPSVLGGVRVLIGSDLYDGTTIRRLTDARHALAGD